MGTLARDPQTGLDHLDRTDLSIARLRRRAAEFRQHALKAHSDGIATAFTLFAQEYESDALRLEAQVPTTRRTSDGRGM